jgi:hypothetical protein
MTMSPRGTSAGHFQLAIDGMPSTAFVKSVDGGWPKINVSDEAVGGEIQHVKHGTTVEVDPIQLEVGMSSADYLLYWIACSWDRRFARHDGSIVHADFDKRCTFIHEFMGALIEETTFPSLDASSKEVAYMKVKLRPEGIKFKKGDGHTIHANEKGHQKLWQCSAFRFSLDGLDCKKVNKIDGFSVKQGIKPVTSGHGRMPELEPTSVTYPDLKISMTHANSGSVFDWYDKVVCQGVKDTSAERDGSIEFLTPSRDKTLLRINLYGVGIKGFNIPKADAGQDAMKRCTFDLYVTRMEIAGDVRYGLE